MQSFNDLPASSSTLVSTPELQLKHGGNDDDQRTRDHRGVDAGPVPWLILLPEDSAAHDATDAAGADQGRRSKSALPLAADVVGLVGEDARHVGVGGRRGEEDAEVTDSDVCAEAEQSQTDDAEEGVEDDEGTAEVVLVTCRGSTLAMVRDAGLYERSLTEDRAAVHPDGSNDVRRRNEALRGTDVEAHTVVEDDWQKVCDSVSPGRKVSTLVSAARMSNQMAYTVVVRPKSVAKPQTFRSAACFM